MYGARLLAAQPSIRAALGGTPTHWQTFGAVITYTINIPVTMFVVSVIGAGWRRSMWWVAAGVSAFAVIGIASDLVTGSLGSMSTGNSWLVLTILTIGVLNIAEAHRRFDKVLTEHVVLPLIVRADLIPEGAIEEYVALHWLEWNGGALRLTATETNVCAQIRARSV